MVTVEKLTEYNADDAAGIGSLLPVLSPDFSGEPIPEDFLQEIISSHHHEQLVARQDDGKIVGIATLSITIGVGAGRKAYLEDFVVDPSLQGHGIGSTIWDEISKWCQQNNLKLQFTSNAKRESAQHFYLKHGAIIYDTVVFKYDPR